MAMLVRALIDQKKDKVDLILENLKSIQTMLRLDEKFPPPNND